MPNNVLFPHTADGTHTISTDYTNLVDTESTDAPKDVLLVVTHGLCVVNGAATAIIKSGSNIEGVFTTDPLVNPGANTFLKHSDPSNVEERVLAMIKLCEVVGSFFPETV